MPQPSSHLLIALAYVGFVSLGLPDGLLGVAWPSIRTFFHLPLDASGALLVMFTAGCLGSSFSSGHLLARLSVGTLLALSCLATAISLLGYALTRGGSWSGWVSWPGSAPAPSMLGSTRMPLPIIVRGWWWLHACCSA